MSIRRGDFGSSRCVAARPSSSSRLPRRSWSETKRNRCGLPMLPQLAHAISWSCPLVATGRSKAGWRFSTLRYCPADDAKRQSEPVPGAPAFGNDSVVDRGPQGVEPAGGSVRPGLHSPRVGGHKVAWWDPNVLRLDVEENVGLRQQRILEADESGTEVARGEQAYSPTGSKAARPHSPKQAAPLSRSKLSRPLLPVRISATRL